MIEEKGYAEAMTQTVEPALAALREDVMLPVDGGALHAEVYATPGARRAVLILHGYTESAEKFREMTWAFLQAGYAVFAPDHRGHGQSLREVEPTDLTHVTHFSDYVHDAEALVTRVIRPRIGETPLVLYAHSMGGAVGAMLLMAHPDWFARAVLTAPMIAPVSAPLPRWGAKLVANTFCALGMGKKRAFVGKPFDPARETYERGFSTSRARFDYYTAKRLAQPHLQNCAPTYNWVREAMGVTDVLLDPAACAKIRTPLLLCQAGQDTIVCLPEQNQFVRQVPGAQLRVFEAAKHEIYGSSDDVMRPYLETVLGFLADPAPDENGACFGGV